MSMTVESSTALALRDSHRGAMHAWQSRLLVLTVVLLGSTTCAEATHAQAFDYRIVAPASHMRLWPIQEELVARKPEPSTPRVAQLPTPALEVEELPEVEVLIVPKENPQPLPQPFSETRDCYQAPLLSATTVNISPPSGTLPIDAALECAAVHPPTGDLRLDGAWSNTEQHWSATCLCHRPLYFEETNAERYGYTPSYFLQPLISAGRFFATIPALPYKMAVDRPHDCVYTLGHYRPGSCVPRRWHHLPWRTGAALVETGVIAGMILVIP